MKGEVITGRIDIGPLWLRVPEAIRREVRIDTSAYARLTYGYDGGASDNWDETAAALDLLNLRLGQAATTDLPSITRFLETKVADRRFMQKEFGSWIYVELHFEPTVLQFAEMRQRGNAELAAGLRSWLRALGGWLAWTGCWGPGKTWASGRDHFVAFGLLEGRRVNGLFNEAVYLANNPDVAAAVGPGRTWASGLCHYMVFGQFERRVAV